MSSTDEVFAERSSLTELQIRTIRLHKKVRSGELTSREARLARGDGSVIPSGMYYRVLSQAKANIRQSLNTLLLCSYLGVVKAEDVTKLLSMVSRLSQADEEQLGQAIAVIDALVSKIVML